MKTRLLERETHLQRGLNEVFGFFSRAENLDRLTPPWLDFRILTPQPIEMKVGSLITYRIVLHGIPIRWITRIAVWNPPHRFVDEQIRGPYRKWVHEHVFEERAAGTWMRDRVEYSVWGGPLEPLIHGLFVGPDVKRIFDYREQEMRRRMGG